MLAFFRKYEKTFFLFVFVPAVISLGISGVMVTVFENLARDTPDYEVFGKEVDFNDVIAKGRGQDHDQILNAYTWEQLADTCGIVVPVEDIKRVTSETIKQQMMQTLVSEEMAKRGLQPGTQEYQQQMFSVYFQVMQNFKLTPELYDRFLSLTNLDDQRFEKLMRAEARRQRLLGAAADLVSVDKELLQAAFQEEHHRRAFEAITIAADDHVPTKGDVTDDELTKWFNLNRRLFKTPREAQLHVLRLPLAKFQADAASITSEERAAFYEGNKGYFRDDAGAVKPLDAVKDEVTQQLIASRAEASVLEALGAASDTLRSRFQVAEMATIASSTEIEYIVTEKGSLDAIQKAHPELDNEVVTFWFNRNLGDLNYRPSEPLLSKDAGYIIWAKEVVESKWPNLTDEGVMEKAMGFYCEVSDEEAKDNFARNRQQYKKSRMYKVETMTLTAKAIAAVMKEPTDVQAEIYHEDHADEFGGKPYAEVKAEVVAAWKASEAKKALDEVRTQVSSYLKTVEKEEGKRELVSLDTISLSNRDLPYRKQLVFETIEVAQEDLEDHPVLGSVSTRLTQAKEKEVSRIEPLTSEDGFLLYMLSERSLPGNAEYADVSAKVKKDIMDARAFDRAKAFATKLEGELEGVTGERLQRLLASYNLEPKRSPFFKKTDTELEGYENAAQYINATFRMEVDGTYDERVNLDSERKVLLLRCAARQDAPAEEFAKNRESIRKSAMNKARSAQQAQWARMIRREARGLSAKHLDLARQYYTGGSDIQSVAVRQIALPPDRDILGDWIDAKANELLKEIKGYLDKGEDFEKLALQRSEDDTTRPNGGVLGIRTRGDLFQDYGSNFENKIWNSLKAEGDVSEAIESDKGFHLVKLLNIFPRSGQTQERRRFAHIMISKDVYRRAPPEEVMKKARDETRKRMGVLLKRLETEPFGRVARDFESDRDLKPNEKGNLFDVDYLSPFRVLASEILEEQIPMPFEYEGAWHVVVCGSDKSNTEAKPDVRRFCYYHVGFDVSKRGKRAEADAKAFREALFDFRQSYESDGQTTEAPWGEVLSTFKERAATRSDMATREKGGVLGAYEYRTELLAYGSTWLSEVMALARKDGQGARRSGVVETPYGFHIIEVVDVERPGPLDLDPNAAFEATVIENAPWD